MKRFPLKSLHPDSSLSKAKLDAYRKIGTSGLIDSLKPGEPGSLKVQPNGTIMDGRHRIYILHERGIGRSAIMVALVLVTCGMQVDLAFSIIEKARGRPVPDTKEQKTWVEQYAAGLQLMDILKVAENVESYKKVHDATKWPGKTIR